MTKKLILKNGLYRTGDKLNSSELDLRKWLYDELVRFSLYPDEPCCDNDDTGAPPSESFVMNAPTLISNILTISGTHNGTPFNQTVDLSTLAVDINVNAITLVGNILTLTGTDGTPHVIDLSQFVQDATEVLTTTAITVNGTVYPIGTNVETILTALSNVPPLQFTRDEFLNPVDGTTNFTLSQTPNNIFPPIVTQGGSHLTLSDYSITGNVLTLTNPIASSSGGAGGSDIIVQYSY